MQSSQAYSQAPMQPSSSVRICGEMPPNAAAAGLSIPSIPSFSQEQNIGIRDLMTAIQIAMDQAFDQAYERNFSPLEQPNPTPPSTQQQSNSLSQRKKKRNQKRREHHKKKKKKAQTQTLRVTVQELDQMQKVKHSDVQFSV